MNTLTESQKIKSRPKLVAISGADGSGKSTVISHLQETYSGQSVVASVWDMLSAPEVPHMFRGKDDIQNYLAYVGNMSRPYFLLHSMSAALEHAMAKNSKIIFIDSYWYKYMAIEMAHGLSLPMAMGLVEPLPVPDLVVYIQIAPEVALQRKQTLSRYESGGEQDQHRRSESFLKLQSQLNASLAKLHPPGLTKMIDSHLALEEVFGQAVGLIESLA